MITLQKFASEDFLGAIKDLFVQLSVPVNYVSDKPFKKGSLKEKEIEKLKEYKATLINSAVTGRMKVN